MNKTNPIFNHSILHTLSWVPLGIAAVWSLLDPNALGAQEFVFSYALTLLFFASGIRFGMHYGRFRALVWHQKLILATPLIAIAAILASGNASLGLLVFGFGAQGAIDSWGGHVGVVPDRYVTARLIATGLTVTTLIAIILLG